MQHPSSADGGAPPKVAYLTNIYPSVSHTFIRREICGLEAMGYEIARYAVRQGERLVDPADVEEARKTTYLLSGRKVALLFTALPVLLSHIARLPLAVSAMLSMHCRSERGIVRHVAYLLEAAALVRDTCRRGVQHVHVHFGTNAAAVARLAFLLGGPTYSMTIHGPDEFDAPVGYSLDKKIDNALFVGAISDYCASQLMRWSPCEQWDKIERINCTVPEEWFVAAATPAADNHQLVCVGRLSAQKGQLLLLEAVRKVLDGGDELSLVLVGDGEMRPEIERRIQELGLGRHVTLAGWQSEAQVRAHLAASRALVLPSFAEGLPMVIMEAMAMQRAVVVTYITGIPELVRAGEHGWKASPGNAEAFAAKIRLALRAPVEQLASMGAAGAATVRARHSVATECAKLDALFRKHCAQGRGGQRTLA